MSDFAAPESSAPVPDKTVKSGWIKTGFKHAAVAALTTVGWSVALIVMGGVDPAFSANPWGATVGAGLGAAAGTLLASCLGRNKEGTVSRAALATGGLLGLTAGAFLGWGNLAPAASHMINANMGSFAATTGAAYGAMIGAAAAAVGRGRVSSRKALATLVFYTAAAGLANFASLDFSKDQDAAPTAPVQEKGNRPQPAFPQGPIVRA